MRRARLAPLLSLIALVPQFIAIPHFGSSQARDYGAIHTLQDSIDFKQEEWQSVNITNLNYKYHHGHHRIAKTKSRTKTHGKGHHSHRPPGGHSHEETTDSSPSIISGITGAAQHIEHALKSLFGYGKPEPVAITWYTGHDLLNPSCWPKTEWAPTVYLDPAPTPLVLSPQQDESFVCALTLEGWYDRPKCFEFVELCNNHRKCIFVRVVDTCAGCAPGSKHVDLTKSAFSALADLDEGYLNVYMRRASQPTVWSEELWGPADVHRTEYTKST
ncbi:hypothetical protein AX16_000027 [Volvariella volvacea WC 439]|nr:hypothetical protein AX16_000027 [Volvariella volvacea WC 439]